MSGALLSAIGNFNPPAAVVVPSMTIGTKTITYSVGKIFDYYDSIVTSPGSDANITVTQNMTCTVQLTSAGGSTNLAGTAGGGGQALTFSFTFKTGTTYVLRLGAVANENSSTNGGGYSGLFISSVSSTNAIAVVGGGGGGGWRTDAAAFGLGQGGVAGSVGPTAVTNGIGFAGATAAGTGGGGGGSGSAAGAGGAAPGGPSGTAGSGPLSSSGGGGATSGVYVGGGGGGGYYSGGGGGANSGTPAAGGGGGGGSFLYTGSADPTKTATYSSSRGGSYVTGSFSSTDASGRPFMGRAGASGSGSAGTTVYLQWWTTLSSWLRPIPGGAATVTSVPTSYECALGADVPAGVGTTAISLVYKVVTTAIANAGATTIPVGDCRRLTANTYQFEVAVASPYVLTATGASTAGITVSALAAAIPSGTTLYLYPVSSTTATTAGAICGSGVSGYSFSNAGQSPVRIDEPGGTYIYGFAPQGTTTNFTGGTTTPVTMNLAQAIYPSATLTKGSAVRIPKASGEFGLSVGASGMRGAAPGAVRITMN